MSELAVAERERELEQARQERLRPALPAAVWVWDDVSKRFRNTRTGRYITQRQAITLRDYYIAAKKADMDRLSRQLLEHNIDLQQWVLEMRRQSKDAFINEYMLARGGRNNMTQADWGRVGNMLRDQYRYVDNFARDIDAGKVSGGQIRTRARMYVDSATQAYERAKTESLGVPRLPQYPGDGQTQCRSNCQCHLDIQDGGDHWNVTWRLGVAEHCPDCVRLSEEWRPLVVTKQQ